MKIKICGLKYPYNIYEVATLQPDMMGFIFYDGSKRRIEGLPDLDYISAQKVGVFVNASIKDIINYTDHYDLDYIQLHGDETPDFVEKLKVVLPYKVGLIKAFRVNEQFDFSTTKEFAHYCDYFLFDASGDGYGGHGKAFNWEKLKDYQGKTPFFLAGGLSLENLDAALSLNVEQLAGLDFNSKLEIEPGVKDTKKVERIINKIKNNATVSS